LGDAFHVGRERLILDIIGPAALEIINVSNGIQIYILNCTFTQQVQS
jgi:hypothetical protein